MHELAITQSVVDAVTERTGDARVVRVRVRVGRLAGVVPDAMRFCFELVTAGTPLDGAALEFEQPEGRGHCRTCGAAFVLADLILLCPCGSADVEVVAGRELAVASVVLSVPAGTTDL
jgi:hydrogenase nickel incorporation protein HypA/HybF